MDLLKSLNFFNTFIQGILFAYSAEYWVNDKIKSKKRVTYMAIMVSLFILSIDIIFKGSSLSYFLIHAGIIIVTILPYNKDDKKKAIISVSLVYNTGGIMALITSVICYEVLVKYEYSNITQAIAMYLPQFIFTYMVLFKPRFIFNFYKRTFSRIKWSVIVILSLYVDYAIAFILKHYAIDTNFFVDFTIVTFLALLIVTVYFFRVKNNYLEQIDRQRIEIEKLNEKVSEIFNLENDVKRKIEEMNKIKER